MSIITSISASGPWCYFLIWEDAFGTNMLVPVFQRKGSSSTLVTPAGFKSLSSCEGSIARVGYFAILQRWREAADHNGWHIVFTHSSYKCFVLKASAEAIAGSL